MRPIGFGCQDHHHPHEVIVRGFPVGGESRALRRDDPPVGLLTLWRCPTLHQVGGYWHDLRHRPEDQRPTHPDLDELPAR